jgi:thiol-disulfide isomerase/thioredoxin
MKIKLILYLIILSKTIFTDPIGNFHLFDLKDNKYNFYEVLNFDKKTDYIVLYFSSIYCKPCLKLTPILKQMEINNKNIAVHFVFMELSDELNEYVTKNKIKYAYTDPTGLLFSYFGIYFYPTYYLFNKNGELIEKYSGVSLEDIKDIEKKIKK